MVKAGGKRLRPALVLIAGLNGEYDPEKLLAGAVSVELMHMASLIHDDVLDAAETRRGLPTVLSSYGREVALSAGDFLFATSFSILCDLGVPELLLIICESALALSIGELKQMAGVRSLEAQTLVNYLGRIKDKTASLFHASCRMGGILGRVEEGEMKKLSRYGESLGMAFQICDDILDLTGTEEVLGKPPGLDLREGLATLPVLYALEETNFDESIVAVIEGKETDNHKIQAVIEKIRQSGAIERSKDEAKTYIKHAVHMAEELSEPQVKESLISIGDFVMERCR